MVTIQHKGRTDKLHKWQQIEDDIYRAINDGDEVPGICEKRKIYNGDTLVPYGVQIEKRGSSYLCIGDLFKITKGELASEAANEDGEYDFITAAEDWKKHDMYQMDSEAIVYAVSAEGSLGRAHYVKGRFMASNLCVILQEKNHTKYPLDLEYYSYHLMSIRKTIVNTLKDGTSKLTISKDKLERYLIEYVPIEVQQRRKEVIRKRMKDLAELQKRQEELSFSLYSMD